MLTFLSPFGFYKWTVYCNTIWSVLIWWVLEYFFCSAFSSGAEADLLCYFFPPFLKIFLHFVLFLSGVQSGFLQKFSLFLVSHNLLYLLFLCFYGVFIFRVFLMHCSFISLFFDFHFFHWFWCSYNVLYLLWLVLSHPLMPPCVVFAPYFSFGVFLFRVFLRQMFFDICVLWFPFTVFLFRVFPHLRIFLKYTKSIMLKVNIFCYWVTPQPCSASFLRTPPKWQLWRVTQANWPQENSDQGKILTTQMGNQWLCWVHCRWASAWRNVLCCGTWRPRREAWQWGFHFTNHTSEARLSICTNLWGIKNLCPRWGIESLSSPPNRGPPPADTLWQLWRWCLCLGIQSHF